MIFKVKNLVEVILQYYDKVSTFFKFFSFKNRFDLPIIITFELTTNFKQQNQLTINL